LNAKRAVKDAADAMTNVIGDAAKRQANVFTANVSFPTCPGAKMTPSRAGAFLSTTLQ
jgi:hypothetical protein